MDEELFNEIDKLAKKTEKRNPAVASILNTVCASIAVNTEKDLLILTIDFSRRELDRLSKTEK
jgi:hypothetical protein